MNPKLDPEQLYDVAIEPRWTREAYVAAIERDLLEAIPHLEEKYNQQPQHWGRVSRGAARMILLRLYMHEKEWAKAEAVAYDIVSMGYELLPRYADVFNIERNNELIYAVPATESSPNWYVQEVIPSNFARSNGITRGGGWYGLGMPWDFYDLYEAHDRRLETIIAEYTDNRGRTVNRNTGLVAAIPLKFTNIQHSGPGYAFDQPVFRYAETLLSLAEAINEQRGPEEAYQYVNQVRERAGLEPWSGLTQAEFRDSLLVERGRELYGEGVRRMDLIRHGKFIESAHKRGIANAQPHHVLFPIPLPVIIQGEGIIEQNPGY